METTNRPNITIVLAVSNKDESRVWYFSVGKTKREGRSSYCPVISIQVEGQNPGRLT